MNNYSDEVEILIKLNSEYLEQLTNISKVNNISLNGLLNNLINDFLNNNNFQNYSTQNYQHQHIDELIKKAIAPLIKRIEKLENQTIKNTQPSSQKKTVKPKKIIPEEKRQYLPRHQVWQILKKTTFVQHSGYENFLKATPQELENYNIFFDTDKKRFYIEQQIPPNTFSD